MKMVPVSSSNLAAVGYDPQNHEMHIEFTSGHTYAYYGVPEEIYRLLMAAPSLGSFFHQYIRNRYSDTRIA